LADRLVSEMSDGERQKVLIARALAQQPRLLVLDEATAFLDLPRRVETMQLLRDLARQHRLAVLLSSHDLELAMRYADALWVIDPWRHLHTGAPEDLALNGVLGATFAADGLAFDLERGELVVGGGGRTPMRLVGDGVRATWAKRALERAGFVIRPDAPHAVHVLAAGYAWVPAQGPHRPVDTLHALVEQLLGGESSPQQAVG
jgi:iron complex transport system ATP-binding protein